MIEIILKKSSRAYKVDIDHPIDISIPLNFNGKQPNAYDVPHATSRAYEDDNFIGDTRKGGSCNFEEHKLIPHCNGTHTECIGHISLARISIHEVLQGRLITCTLITINPTDGQESSESYLPDKQTGDKLITKNALTKALADYNKDFTEGLIVRTLPNDDSKKLRRYMEEPPPYFSIEAIKFITDLNVKHLLVDTPSVDRAFDEGKLTSHHLFWQVPLESHDVDSENHSLKTITEMIYVHSSINDGQYLLDLQIPNFVADAAPSRPLLFRIEKI